ncbi:4'-phosphopantetheinyl transferase superfamily protein [Streptomonospora sp. S1-112]|uniref:4'-phosphopantetheinyl transferase superfamily protein n=1 Tax=Streptomonospora mangrovi TaxID=2883123 RepID=A0A9X3NMZ8_9ACTN|nr:4'-phosphopantetheinyl transferase superfamily protein [Streptomonospora mangrovi]MDA0566719.1 4'-phosphopantetheinyl transferase superfamily protein [Streptomonospora mangrovi]
MTPLTCDLWWGDITATTPDQMRALHGMLNAEERQRHAGYRLQADKDRFALARGLARLAVGRAAGIAAKSVAFDLLCFACERGEPAHKLGPHGKPRPSGPAEGVEISFSHSGDRVLLAMTRGVAVGADVQQVRGIALGPDSLADDLLNEAEMAHYTRLDPEQRQDAFFTLWSRKEALVKATREGIKGVTEVTISPPGAPIEVHAWDSPHAPPPGHVQLADVPAGDDYRAAVAVLTPRPLEIAVGDTAELLRDLPNAPARTDRRGAGTRRAEGRAETRTAPAARRPSPAAAPRHRQGPSAAR